MGVFCQIYINRPIDGVHRPGQTVSGIIKYSVNKETEFRSIAVCLVGEGKCRWTESQGTGKNRREISYYGDENYATQKIKINDKESPGMTLVEGTYEYEFKFILPEEIPSSHRDNNCSITYKIVMVFKNSSFFSFTKKFESEILVKSFLDSLLPEGEIIYGLNKELWGFFGKNKQNVNLKAIISKSVCKPGAEVIVDMEVENDTDIKIPSIRTLIVCIKTLTANCGKTKKYEEIIEECTSDSTKIYPKCAEKKSYITSLPSMLYTIQNSKIIKNEYFVRVTVRLPIPHFNAFVDMSLLIGDTINNTSSICEDFTNDAPPSYWQVMIEDSIKKNG